MECFEVLRVIGNESLPGCSFIGEASTTPSLHCGVDRPLGKLLCFRHKYFIQHQGGDGRGFFALVAHHLA